MAKPAKHERSGIILIRDCDRKIPMMIEVKGNHKIENDAKVIIESPTANPVDTWTSDPINLATDIVDIKHGGQGGRRKMLLLWMTYDSKTHPCGERSEVDVPKQGKMRGDIPVVPPTTTEVTVTITNPDGTTDNEPDDAIIFP